MSEYRVPSATYRIQFGRDFTFKNARELVPYLFELGITDVYASPIFRARRSSQHGYSVTNPMEINPDLGSRASFDALARRLKARGMGFILDIVPNHMALSHENPWWVDVLENGPSSPYAIFFDIDWHPPNSVLEGKVLLPILGSHYGRVLEAGELQLGLDEAGFFVRYYDARFALDPGSYRNILSHRLAELEKDLGESNPAVIGVKGLVTLSEHLPPYTTGSRRKAAERRKDKEIIKSSLWLLYRGTPAVREFLDENIRIFNGTKGNSASFDLLDRLLDVQPYRLAYWRVALETINYRRFFSINDLIGIRIEDQRVFEAFKHGLLFGFVREGKVTGIRVDHIDGLYDPEAYLHRLREGLDPGRGKQAEEGGIYIVVEKILEEGETIPPEWPVSGSTGYDFLSFANGLLVDESGYRKLRRTFASLTSLKLSAADIVYEKKKRTMGALFGGEIENLGYTLGVLASHDRQARDLSVRELVEVLKEVTACLPVYRTYIRKCTVSDRDRRTLEAALSEVRRRRPSLDPSAVDFVRRLLLMEFQPHPACELKDERIQFVMRWQQFTGPVMAKGLEDTALYVYNPLVSLNEVGTNFKSTPVEEFHRFNEERRTHLPFTMNATSTHDTKRSEDVRARISVLSEMAEEWEESLGRWRQRNAGKKTTVGGTPVPGPNEEQFLYQTMLGAWPLRSEEIPAFGQRLRDYMVKAAREATEHTRWITPDVAYEEALVSFIQSVLDESGDGEFMEDFLRVQARLARFGAWKSLSQVLLKTTSPGVPDFYQGNELWDFSLVDPDNRRPVDFKKRVRMLDDLVGRDSKDRAGLIDEIVANWQDGRIKLYTTWKALRFRRDHRELFLEGAYLPLYARGGRGSSVIAFARSRGEDWAITAVPRLVVKTSAGGNLPRGEGFLDLPEEAPRSWTNVFTDEILEVPGTSGHVALPLRRMFRRFPVALLRGTAHPQK